METSFEYLEIPHFQEILNFLPMNPDDEELQTRAISICLFRSASIVYDLHLLRCLET